MSAMNQLQELEIALEEARERVRLAKTAVKEAKVIAKAAKKDRRRARKALIEAQSAPATGTDEEDRSNSVQPSLRAVSHDARKKHVMGANIPDSPEVPRKRPGKKRSAKKVRESTAVERPAIAAADVDHSAATAELADGLDAE